jgi:hypothetical protein
MTEVEWTQTALDLLDGLDTEAQERLVAKLDEATDLDLAPTRETHRLSVLLAPCG